MPLVYNIKEWFSVYLRLYGGKLYEEFFKKIK